MPNAIPKGTVVEAPRGRTQRQPLQAYCLTPECIEGSDGRYTFTVENEICCPKCGRNEWPHVGILTLVHWVRPSAQGPLKTSDGGRAEIACDPKRQYIATASNLEAGTNYPPAVNCPQCLKELEKCHVHGP